MTESAKYYKALRKEYPETISKDQFYRMAHISKATALHLLQSGLVPCKDTGKKTRRYKIRTDDVICYMIDREIHPEIYRAPDQWYQHRSGHYNSRITYRKELMNLSDDEKAAFREYIEDELWQYGDLLTIVEAVEAIGYCDTSLHRWCNTKKLRAFSISGKFLIPKISLTDFLVSQHSFDIIRKSWKHTLLIKGFLDTLNTTK
ncbi:helix-turn-helix domain-containing protein [Oscillibacter sp. MSJ-31]|uniref:helix-turn-helix domain-containing protein n=1 Tax=Oscillibacter sp. MSJ-31 TaxID=2841526 RepID=UPI001C10D67D|nr:helix-turn-helix domain-containing protein [Oscillibacter sp. MSJ-31]MBU5456955.1 helix-turn-helix domain-containing protein [Oscillibacter sp. MSJ-31]